MLEIFQYDFMQRAFIAGTIIGTIAPVIGIFLVVRRFSLLADTLSHVSLVGVVAGTILHLHPVAGAMIASSAAALAMEKLRAKQKIFGESILALFLSGSLALAIVLLGFAHGLNANIFAYLFGSITTVSQSDLFLIGGFGVVVIATAALLWKHLFLVSYDEELSKANGLPTARLNGVLMILAAITVSLSMRIIGTLLIGALMVIPVLTATQFGKSFNKTAIYAVLISLLAVFIGLLASFFIGLPSGGAIVVVALIFFAFSFLFQRAIR